MDEKIEKRFTNVSASKTFGNIVAHFGLKEKKVLDIGCSYGEFLAHFGPGSVGVSISKTEAEYGAKRNLDIRLGNIESDEFVLEEIFDVIFANNIFEHLYSPHHFLVTVNKYLKHDGILILGVPCVPKIVSLLRFRKFRGSLSPEHINFFTKSTLKYTVIHGGWNIHSLRGFHFRNAFVDHLLDIVYPHFYTIATVDEDFQYTEKRLNELAGYANYQKER